MSNLLILVIGIPAAGKSSWVSQYIKTHAATIVVSNDQIRLELTGTMECKRQQNKMIYTEARHRARKALESHHDVIIDGCNVEIEEWLAYKDICLPTTLLVAKIFDVTPHVAIERMRDRERKVPEEIITDKWQQFQSNKQFLPYIFNFII